MNFTKCLLLEKYHHRRAQLLAYLFIIIVGVIIPVKTLAQEEKGGNRVLYKFDLLLLSNQKDLSQSLMLVNTKDHHEKLVVKLPNLQSKRGSYEHVAPDMESDMVYWSSSTGCIGYFGVSDLTRYGVLYNATSQHKITHLTFTNNTLYWIEDAKDIKSMQVSQNKSLRVLIKAEEQEKIKGLDVDHKTGTLYYSVWSTVSRTNGKIWSLKTATTSPTLVASNLQLPTSISIAQPPYLHWISSPAGIYFHVERLNTEDLRERKVIVKQPHQHGNSLAVSCNSVYWTDVGYKRVWTMDADNIPEGKQVKGDVLGEQQDWRFVEVVAIPHDCEDTHIQPVTLTIHQSTTPVTTEQPLSSSSSESVEVEHKNSANNNNKATSRRGVRLCTIEEFSSTCATPNSDVICIVLGEMRPTPLCLYQKQPKQLSPVEAHDLLEAQESTPSPDDPQHQESNTTAETLKFVPLSTSSSWPPEVIIIVSVLSTLATVMSLISLYMMIRVRSLSKKPIIRRRVVVSTRTSESGSSTPASVCEMIDIENCCNMNVCETPCYERTLLQPSNPNTTSTHTQSTTQNGTTLVSVNSNNSTWGGCGGKNSAGKEDKRCLLTR